MSKYNPSTPTEQSIYEELWNIANPSNQSDIGGNQAVEFFKSSKVDIYVLRQIWSFSTSNPTINKEEFFTALRYITLAQKGVSPLTKEKLTETAQVYFGYPIFYAETVAVEDSQSIERLQSQDVQFQEFTASINEFKRSKDESDKLLAQNRRTSEELAKRAQLLQQQLNEASAGVEPNASEALATTKKELVSNKLLVEALIAQCAIASADHQKADAYLQDLHRSGDGVHDSAVAREENLKSLQQLLKTLKSEMGILFSKIGEVAEYGYLDVKQLCSNQELMRDLREFGDLDHELRTRTLAFVKKSKSDEEKELLKQAVLAAKLPIDLNSEALKFHLSVAQRVQAVEIKITTNHVPSLGGSASTAKAVVHAKRFGLKTGSGDKHDGSASPSKFAF